MPLILKNELDKYYHEYEILKSVFSNGPSNFTGEIITQSRTIHYYRGERFYSTHSYHVNSLSVIIGRGDKIFLKLDDNCSIIDLEEEAITEIKLHHY